MPRSTPAPPAQEAIAPPADEVLVLQVPLVPVPRRRKRSTPETPAAPGPTTLPRRPPPPPIEDLLIPDPSMPPPGRERCVAIMMQSAGHSLDLGCRLCFTNCVYAAPCGCGGWDCIDRRQKEPLVVFTETVKSRRRARRSGEPPLLLRLLKPWTWFRRKAKHPGQKEALRGH